MKVSILINNYNNEKYIKECIESAINQNYSNFEVIVCDNGSTDESVDIIKSFGDKITFVENITRYNQNFLNQYYTIAKAFKVSKGEIIFLLDGDDSFKKNKLKEIVPLFIKDRNLIFVQHYLEEIDENSQLKGIKRPFLINTQDIQRYITEEKAHIELFAPTSSQVYRRNFFEKVINKIKQPTFNLIWSDLRLPYHAIFNGKIITLNKMLANYRRHSTNDSSKLSNGEIFDEFYRQQIEYFNLVQNEYKEKKIDIKPFPYILENNAFLNIIDEEELLKSINVNDSIYIWGAGIAGRGLNQFLQLKNISINGFIEGNPIKQGEILDGVKVFNKTELNNIEKAKVLITPFYARQVIINSVKNRFINIDFIDIYQFTKEKE